MLRNTLQLPVETPENPFVAPVNIEIIESFMHTVGYQGVVDKVSAFYTKFLAQPWPTMFKYPPFTKLIIADLMKKFPSIPPRLKEDYHSIKNDIPLVSVYTMGNVTVRGMLIPDAFLTEEICVTDDYKKYKTVSTPRAHRTPTLTTASPQGKKRKQSDDRERDEMAEATLLNKEEIEKMVEGEENEESYASMFAGSMLNDDSGTRIDPESHKEKPKVVDDDDKDDKKDENDKKDDDVEKADDATEKKDNDDQTDHTLVGSGSMETRNEQMQTPIPTPTRSFRKDLFSDKIIFEELMTNVSPTTATTSKTKSKRGFTSNKTKILPRSIVGMCMRHG
ncbi:hypothetical protein Tco_0738725 [Tanacetum coccineum]